MCPAKRHHAVGERELLCIFETLRKFHDILHGVKLKTLTDHQNLTFNASNSRGQRWRHSIEHHNYVLRHVKLKDNFIGDLISTACTFCNDDSIFSDYVLHIEVLSNDNAQSNESHLENVLGESTNSLSFYFPMFYQTISERKKKG